MAYNFEAHEHLPHASKRIASEQVEKALRNIACESGDVDVCVHDVRVIFKKIRALLRLIRGAWSDDAYGTENLYFRDLNRKLSRVRDSSALLEVLGKLRKHSDDEVDEELFEAVKSALEDTQEQGQTAKAAALREIEKETEAAQRRIGHWSTENVTMAVILDGVANVYRQGRRDLEAAYETQTVEAFHEWRKKVKYLLYQLRLLKHMWPEILKPLTVELKKLSDYLSEDHDLALVEKSLSENASMDRDKYERVAHLIDRRRRELHIAAKHLGERIYAERPKAFKKRLEIYASHSKLE